MHRGLHALLLGFLLSLSAGTVLARDPLKIDDQNPKDFSAVQQNLDTIQPYLDGAQCGGSVNQSAAGTIATVTGVPGHTGQWNGAIPSGMAKRDDPSGDNTDFKFPDTAQGFTTDCWVGTPSIQKQVWRPGGTRPGEITMQTIVYPYPEFQDPACRWRWQDANGNSLDVAPDIPLKDQYDTWPTFAESTKPPQDRQSPENCTNFCTYLNSFQYENCVDVGEGGNALTGTYATCNRWANLYICSNQEVKDAANACNPGSTEMANAKQCTGGQCRCQQGGGPSKNNGAAQCVKDPDGAQYFSYYRQYTGSFQRTSVPTDVATDDASRSNVKVTCYGFYNEFDPFTHQTQSQDRRCVINIDVSGMRDTQMGKGDYGQKTQTTDTDPQAKENQRPQMGNTLWDTQLGWAFSFLDESTFQSDPYNKNLTNVFTNIDTLDNVKVMPSWPVANAGQTSATAKSDFLRSFDDTGLPRIIVSWWQKQQTEVATLLHPPVVRLLLPPGYAFGVDPNDPLLAATSGSSSSNGIDIRSQRMEVQIGATEDQVGTAFASIERSLLLHLEEEPVSVTVPFGDPTDFRLEAQRWCSWYMTQSSQTDCKNAPANIKKFIDQLNNYADQIEQVRGLRAQIAQEAGKILQLQSALTKPISDWVSQNLTTYSAFLKQQKVLNAGVTNAWIQAETAMSTFHDQTNMPWCMNQRFETPIYSLLDGWGEDVKGLPSRAQNGNISADGLPNIEDITRPQDIIVDFSHILYFTNAFRIPVLKPVQVSIAVNGPTNSDTISNFNQTLPDFPSLPPVYQAISDAMAKLPNVQQPKPFSALALPTVDNNRTQSVIDTIGQITDTVNRMNGRYKAFWKSIGPLGGCVTDANCEQQKGEQCVNGKCQSMYDPQKSCGSETIKNLKENNQCCSFDDSVCQNVEMDLVERFQRIGSRKLLLLNEDYQSVGLPRMTPDTCLPADNTCLILHGEAAYSGNQLQILAPTQLPDLTTDAKSAVRDATLPSPIGNVDPKKFPPYNTDINDLIPLQDIPPPIDLSPPKP